MDANLITQANIAELDLRIADLQSRVTAVELDVTTVVAGLTAQINNAYSNIRTALAAHAAQNYGVAHSGVTAQLHTYKNAKGSTVGTYVISFQIGSDTYYVPASNSVNGVCHTDCGCAANCACNGKCHNGFFK